jgi:hypothetical protein
MSLWGSEIFGATRERNDNEERIRKQTLPKEDQEESSIGLSEKEKKAVNLWVKITFLIVLFVIAIWFIFTQI